MAVFENSFFQKERYAIYAFLTSRHFPKWKARLVWIHQHLKGNNQLVFSNPTSCVFAVLKVKNFCQPLIESKTPIANNEL